MRLAGAGLQVPQLTAVLLTHLHSDHTTDFNDVVTTWWVMPMTAGRALQRDRAAGDAGVRRPHDRGDDAPTSVTASTTTPTSTSRRRST